MGEAAHAPLQSVAFLSLAEFTGKPVAEQARLKELLAGVVARAIEPMPAKERVVVDTADGVAVVVLAPPQDALMLARRARRAAREAETPVALRVVLNHGPVALAPDADGELVVFGDAIAAGATLAALAEAGKVVTSRSFRDALDREQPGRAQRLRPAGTLTDASLRAHDIFVFESADAAGSTSMIEAPRRRRTLVIAGVSAFALVAGGLFVRGVRRARERARVPGVVELAISPWGEVRVNGQTKGRTPPLKRIELPAGKHTIELSHPGEQPIVLQLALDPAEEVTIRHTFSPQPAPAAKAPAPQRGAAPPPQRPAAEPNPLQKEYWRNVRRQLGF